MLRKEKNHWPINSTSKSSHLYVQTRQTSFGSTYYQSPFLIPSYQDLAGTILAKPLSLNQQVYWDEMKLLSWNIGHFQQHAGQWSWWLYRGFYVLCLNVSGSTSICVKTTTADFHSTAGSSRCMCAPCVHTHLQHTASTCLHRFWVSGCSKQHASLPLPTPRHTTLQ